MCVSAATAQRLGVSPLLSAGKNLFSPGLLAGACPTKYDASDAIGDIIAAEPDGFIPIPLLIKDASNGGAEKCGGGLRMFMLRCGCCCPPLELAD